MARDTLFFFSAYSRIHTNVLNVERIADATQTYPSMLSTCGRKRYGGGYAICAMRCDMLTQAAAEATVMRVCACTLRVRVRLLVRTYKVVDGFDACSHINIWFMTRCRRAAGGGLRLMPARVHVHTLTPHTYAHTHTRMRTHIIIHFMTI